MDLKNKIAARWPIIAINTHEPQMVISEIIAMAGGMKRHVLKWSHTDGLTDLLGVLPQEQWAAHGIPPGLDERGKPRVGQQVNYRVPPIPLQTVLGYTHEKLGCVVIAENLHWWFRNEEIRQLICDVAGMANEVHKTLIIVGAGIEVPPELDKKVILIDWPLPDNAELCLIVEDKIGVLNGQTQGRQIHLGDAEIQALADALKGMTAHEATYALNEAYIKLRTFDASPDMLRALTRHKKQVVAKHQMLEYFEPQQGLDQVGGLDLLKLYFRGVAASHSEGAAKFGVRPPLGILLVGPPGTGKTLSSRAAADEIGWPVVRLDLSAVFGSLVGQSEANMRAALATVRAIAPVLIQIDEIEKAMSSRGGDLDGGTSSRVLGIFLTWLQDQMDDPNAPPMFIIATANKAMNLDSALMRRFEDTFFIDLPTSTERADILNIHLGLAGRDAEALGIDLEALADLAEGFAGAELKKAVDAGLRKAYLEVLDGKTDDITQDILAEAMLEIVPVSRSMAEEIDRIRQWAAQVRPASSAQRRSTAPDFAASEQRQRRASAVPDLQ
jgi:ATP-dependent 26S proteasome regulatory subunit